MFGTVMCQLIRCVESRALIELSRRLAPISAAPANVIQVLARNDLIEISGPVLCQSALLTDDDLTAPSGFGLMVLCKAIGLNWTITKSVILNRPVELTDPHFTLDEMYEQYNNLPTTSAQSLLKGCGELQKSDKPLSMTIDNVYYVD